MAGIAILLVISLFRGPPPAPIPPPVVRPEPGPEARPEAPRPKDTALSKAMRDYFRQAPVTMPDILDAMADKVDSGELDTKDSSIQFFKRPAQPMNTALDEIFSPGLDRKNEDQKKRGNIIDREVISGPLRASAKALRRAD
jgi:hypothetical protein